MVLYSDPARWRRINDDVKEKTANVLLAKISRINERGEDMVH